MRGRLVVPIMAIVVAGCSLFPRQTDIRSAELEGPEGRQLRLRLGTCNAALSAEADETEDEVVVTVTARNSSGNDCADTLVIDLTDPLGDRAVVDGSDGQELFVEDPPDN